MVTVMRPHLEILWRLLCEKGSIWISIDDNEQAYLKVLCDEMSGRSPFVASIIWQKRTSSDMRATIEEVVGTGNYNLMQIYQYETPVDPTMIFPEIFVQFFLPESSAAFSKQQNLTTSP